jgi:hypothetical protein
MQCVDAGVCPTHINFNATARQPETNAKMKKKPVVYGAFLVCKAKLLDIPQLWLCVAALHLIHLL